MYVYRALADATPLVSNDCMLSAYNHLIDFINQKIGEVSDDKAIAFLGESATSAIFQAVVDAAHLGADYFSTYNENRWTGNGTGLRFDTSVDAAFSTTVATQQQAASLEVLRTEIVTATDACRSTAGTAAAVPTSGVAVVPAASSSPVMTTSPAQAGIVAAPPAASKTLWLLAIASMGALWWIARSH